MKHFDILLVLGYFRSAAAYLSVIRHLSSEFHIGVLALELDSSLKNKTAAAHDMYMQLCTQFGAEIVTTIEPMHCRLMVVQQFPYPGDTVAAIQANITSDKRVGLMTLAMAGIAQHDAFLTQFAIRKAYVPSLGFTQFLLEQRKATKRYDGVTLEEVGLPYRRYPVFPDFKVDWLIAAPTLFSFHNEEGKQSFLRCVLKILSVIPRNHKIAYKPHNGNALDYFAPRAHYFIAGLLRHIPGTLPILEKLAKNSPARLGKQFNQVLTSMLHMQVLERAKPMKQFTAYADIALEVFLPGVSQGVIGGLSNTIWGTLHFGLPFYNCVDPSLRNGNTLLTRSSDNLLDLNMKYFGVNYCKGEISPFAHETNLNREHERTGDLVSAIRHDVADA